jgi:hypothetical protein
MRRLVSWLLVLGVIWSGWWWIATTGIERGVSAAIDRLPAQGWQADIGSLEQGGYPVDLSTRAEDVSLRRSDGAVAASLPDVVVSAPAYWPGDLTATLGDAPVEIELSGQAYRLTARNGVAEVDLRPEPALGLEAATLTSGEWHLEGPTGMMLTGAGLSGRFALEDAETNTYGGALDIASVELGEDILRLAGLETRSDAALSLSAQYSLQFNRALNRHALRGPEPKVTGLSIPTLDFAWGALEMSGDAELALDASGRPRGAMTLRTTDWERFAALLGEFEAVRDRMGQVNLMLRALANMDGDPETLTLPVRFEDGRTYLGNIELGPAPVLY